GERRPSTLKDVENFAKLADALDYMHIFHPCCNPEDVPQAVRDRYRWQASFNYTEKHVMSAVYSVEALKDVIEMASSIVGGMDELMKNPIMSVIVCSVAPLRHDTINTQILMHCAKNKIPVICSNDVMAGASGPATLAGTIVVTNAETLSGVCLTQLVNPGSPVLMGNVSTIMDMRAGTLAEGAPEQILINLCMAQLSHHYRLPYYGTGGTTDAKIPDAQAGWEKGMTALATALVGSNIVHAFGGLLNSLNLASFEQLVIDDEIAGYITRILRGLDKSSESMALEVIHNVGPGGNFLTTKHTREKWKKAQWMPSISSRIDYERWKKEGAKDAYKVAREKALRILKEHQPTPLEEDVKRKITHIIKEAQQKRRM
ncbi:MAG: trimethylamine methyltransferase family protein, partial [Candidatus Heimdallarchaeota archaeon]